MKTAIALLTVGFVAFAGLAFASPSDAAASALRVIGKSSSSGDFAVTAASGSKKKAKTLYIRGYGRGLSGYAVVACSRGFSIGSKSRSYSAMRSGKLYRVPLPFAGDCDVTASLSGSGRIRLQILG